jgi:short subunit dehydrogenase-like uncharacterized protein
MTAQKENDVDIVLLGATGYVGRLTAQHLARHAPADLRIALAGRSHQRLAQLRDDLGPAAQDWLLLPVDVSDRAAVTDLVARTGLLISTVGPYLRYGLAVVKACAETGTDYADLTGETLFVRRSIDACHELAQQTGARIVHSCGFDAVPSDLAVGLTAAAAAADGNGQLGQTVLRVRSIRAGISGGTIDSMRQQILEVAENAELRPLVADPTCLADGEDPRAGGGPRRSTRRRVRVPLRRRGDGRWETPYVMGGFNRQIVLRSNALSGWSYGPQFRYREVVDTGRGLFGLARATVIAAGSTAVLVGMWLAPTRRVLDRILPDPGQGPSERSRQRGRFLLEVEAETTGGPRYRTAFGADIDPGYGGAAVMLGEAGLSLVRDDNPTVGGVLTPMSALGERLAQRLRAHGFTVATERVDAGDGR